MGTSKPRWIMLIATEVVETGEDEWRDYGFNSRLGLINSTISPI